MPKPKSIIFITILSLLLLWGIGYTVDLIWGDGDGRMVIVWYLQFIIACSFLIYLSSLIRKKGLANIILFFSVLLLAVGVLETVFHVLVNHFIPKQENSFVIEDSSEKKFTVYDGSLGYKNNANRETHESMYKRGELCLNAIYHTDSIGRRITPQSYLNAEDKEYTCFMGCSFAFGYLVGDSSTLEAFYARNDTNSITYNYGVNAYGCHQLLAKLQSGSLRKEIKQEKGKLIYVYIDHHIRRAIGDQFVMETNKWAKNTPYFKLKGDSLINAGSFETGRPFINFIYKSLSKSYVLRFFGVFFPLQLAESHYQLAGTMINKACKSYINQFNNDEFYVLIFPKQSTDIVSYLNKEIKVLDYSTLFDGIDVATALPDSCHPTTKAYQIVAEQLSKDVGNY